MNSSFGKKITLFHIFVYVQSSKYQLNWCLIVLMRYLNIFLFINYIFLLCNQVNISQIGWFIHTADFLTSSSSALHVCSILP